MSLQERVERERGEGTGAEELTYLASALSTLAHGALPKGEAVRSQLRPCSGGRHQFRSVSWHVGHALQQARPCQASGQCLCWCRIHGSRDGLGFPPAPAGKEGKIMTYRAGKGRGGWFGLFFVP